ncbi:MAG: hypothetical protein LBG72_07570 [Spirochaetaceae bacterium]|jgi:hypothetical protein|nr:hypothetical protein [Spirochaetaceae bacterium]
MEYEFIREIFNPCAGNARPDISVSEIEIDNPDDFVKTFLVGTEIRCEKTVKDSGALIYEIEVDGQKQRLTFTP